MMKKRRISRDIIFHFIYVIESSQSSQSSQINQIKYCLYQQSHSSNIGTETGLTSIIVSTVSKNQIHEQYR